ncbi:hypothetical protein [Methylobacterium sp. P5_C11]
MRALLLTTVLAGLGLTPAAACGTDRLPAPGEVVDMHLKTDPLTPDQRARLVSLRAQIAEAVRAEDEKGAQAIEDDAMAGIGYRRVWLRCGSGTHMWVRA